MALGKDLLNVALVIGGGYILIYHVLPALQSGQLGAGGGFAPGGTFLPPAAAAPSTGHRCWAIGNGHNACACAGKQWHQMGAARPCSDCTTYCNTGTTPDLKRPTSTPTPPKHVSSGSVGRQISVNCRQAPNGQYCWKSGNLELCMGGSCETARSYWLQRYGSKPTAKPIAPHLSAGTPGASICYATPTGFGSTKVWKCVVAGRPGITQGIGWRCQGRTASEVPVGQACRP